MKNKHFILALVVLFAAFSANINQISAKNLQSNDSITRNVASFSSVSFDGGFDVVLVPSTKESISIHTDKDKISKVKTEVNNGRLRVYTEEALQYYKVKLVVRYVSLNEIKVNGGVYIQNLELFKSENLKLKVAGGADIKMFIQVHQLDLDFAGGANAEISGSANDLKISINGAGKVEAEKLMVKDAKIEIAGAGYANVNVEKSLDASISGVGAINYSGKPAKVKSQILGIGSIKEK